jgi:Na+/H+ antiporter NhaD/arsenite permease-like protein
MHDRLHHDAQRPHDVNNLPATLVLVPLVASSGPAAVLAVLIGVNIGPT